MLGVLTVSLSNSVTILSDGVTILQKNICQQRFRLNPHKKPWVWFYLTHGPNI